MPRKTERRNVVVTYVGTRGTVPNDYLEAALGAMAKACRGQSRGGIGGPVEGKKGPYRNRSLFVFPSSNLALAFKDMITAVALMLRGFTIVLKTPEQTREFL